MPINVRDPGSLPNVFARVENARALLANRKLDEDVRGVVEALVALATTQHELNKRLWESKKGAPEPHGETHLGTVGSTDDGLAGSGLPSSIDVGDTGTNGTPTLGFAPIDHEHPAPGLEEVLAFAFLGY